MPIFNDEIVRIERLNEYKTPTVDITVSGDHYFYANGILTHNSNSDIELTNTSESIGLPATCDMMFAIIRSEELDQLNQLMVKQLKNRFGDINKYKKFVLGVDRSKMKLYDVEKSAQEDIIDSGQDDTECSGWAIRTKDVKIRSTYDDFKY